MGSGFRVADSGFRVWSIGPGGGHDRTAPLVPLLLWQWRAAGKPESLRAGFRILGL